MMAATLAGCGLEFDSPFPPAPYPPRSEISGPAPVGHPPSQRALSDTNDEPGDTGYGWLALTWIGCVDNGDPDGSPFHSPEGSFHLIVRETDGRILHHWTIPGPFARFPELLEEREWLDLQEKSFIEYDDSADGSATAAVLHTWRGPDDVVAIELWESDPVLGINLNIGRGHDFLYAEVISRADTLPAGTPQLRWSDWLHADTFVLQKLFNLTDQDMAPTWLDGVYPLWHTIYASVRAGRLDIEKAQIPALFIKTETVTPDP